MSEEIKNEEVNESNIDEKLDEMLNDPSIKTEDEKLFLKDVGESLKKGEVPVNLFLNKLDEASSKLQQLTKTNPEFESFVKHYNNKIGEVINEFINPLKNKTDGK